MSNSDTICNGDDSSSPFCTNNSNNNKAVDRPLEDQPTDQIIERLRMADSLSPRDQSASLVRWVLEYVLEKHPPSFPDHPDEELRQAIRNVSEYFIDSLKHRESDIKPDAPAFFFAKFLSLLDHLTDHSRYSGYEQLGGADHALNTFWKNLKPDGSDESNAEEDESEEDESPEIPDDVNPQDPILKRKDVSLSDLLSERSMPDRVIQRIVSLYNQDNYRSRERSIIQALFRIPWEYTGTFSFESLSMIQEQLDENVYGMSPAKTTLLDELALRNKMSSSTSSPLCLVGPPGIGKTHLVQTLADLVSCPFDTVAMAGISDAKKLRGCFPGWKSARPGRIARVFQEMDRMDPIIILDEIDKVTVNTSGNAGDPMSYLIDLLDPDHPTVKDDYLQVDLDVSDAWFIATANDPKNLPDPLRDRMKIVRLSGYDRDDKKKLLENYILQDVLEEYGFSDWDYVINTDFLTEDGREELIQTTRGTAGVRPLKQRVKTIVKRRVRNMNDPNRTITPFGPEDVRSLDHSSGRMDTAGF